MKNLKRALTLVLACAMIFGMFAINASAATAADFSDNETIVNAEAVTVMSQLNIIKGYEDGSFKPTQVVTRAEMCKMLCVALNGGVDPVLGSDSLAIFSDTQGHWANAYISYCFNLGLVNGDSGKGGTFRPEATVTGVEAAKMMLVAMGYNSSFAGFTGADWATNVSVAANQKGLFKNLATLNSSTGLSRDNAAQLIYNGVNAKKVEYDNVLSTDANGQLTATTKIKDVSPAETIISKNYGATKYTAVLMSNENGSAVSTIAAQDAGYTWVNLDGDNVLDAEDELFKVSTTSDLLGKTVTIYVKTDNTQSSKFWEVCGAPVATADNKVVTFTGSKIPSQTQAQFDDAMKAQGISSYNARVFENYGSNTNSVVAGPITTNTAAMALRNGANGVSVSYIDNNGDKQADFISIIKYAVGKVATYSTSGDGYITVTPLSGSNTNVAVISGEKMANVVGADAIAKDDIITYYKLGTKWYVTKCESVTANVTSTESPNAIADGKTYKGSSLVTEYDEAATITTVAAAVNLGKDCVFYLDQNGYVVLTKPAAAEGKYLVVLASNDANGIDTNMDPIRAKVLFNDGTFATINVTKIGGTTLTVNPTLGTEIAELGISAGRIYTYKLLSDGSYDITATAAADTKYLTDVVTNTPALTATVGTSVATAKTVFVVTNAAKTTASVTTGIANAPKLSSLNAGTAFSVALNDANGYAKVVFAVGGTAATTAKFIYVLSTTPSLSLDSNGDTIYTYKTLVNGVATDLIVDGTSKAAAFASTGLYREMNDGTTALAITADNKLTSDTTPLVTGVLAADVSYCANNVITGMLMEADGTAASASMTYNDTTKVYLIDGKTVTESNIGEIAVISGSSATTSNIIMTRASTDTNNANYGVAGVVYMVKSVSAPKAIISTQPTNPASALATAAVASGAVTADAPTFDSVLTYQWYKCAADGTSPVLYADTDATLNIPGSTYLAGTHFFYCTVTNTIPGVGSSTINTNVITVTLT